MLSRREAREPLARRRPTYEEVLKETMTHRLKILPERERRTQQGILLDDVEFDDFDLSKHDRKEILFNENPDKGTQTDLFDKMYSTETSESMKSIDKETTKSEEVESEPTQEKQPDKEEPEREKEKSIMRRMFDAMFGEDKYREELEELQEMRNRRAQREEEQEEEAGPQEIDEEQEEDEDLPMNVKKSYEPSSSSRSSRASSEASSSSSSNRSGLLPIQEEALSEHIQSSPPISVQSSVSSNRTIEYVEEPSLPQSVISSRRSQETIEYIRSRSSSNRSRISISS